MTKLSKIATPIPAPDALVAALALLDVDFVMCARKVSGSRFVNRPIALLAGLARQKEARLRLAIIPLLLRHPEFASAAPQVVKQLEPRRRVFFKLYYTAAVLLQRRHARRLRRLRIDSTALFDWFSKELSIPSGSDPVADLQILASRHREHSGLELNWLGTYEHALERFVKHLDKRREWAQLRQMTSAPI